MTVIRNYRCDMCNMTKQPSELIGLHWKHIAAGEFLVVCGVANVEKHLCAPCLEQLQRIKIPTQPTTGETK